MFVVISHCLSSIYVSGWRCHNLQLSTFQSVVAWNGAYGQDLGMAQVINFRIVCSSRLLVVGKCFISTLSENFFDFINPHTTLDDSDGNICGMWIYIN